MYCKRRPRSRRPAARPGCAGRARQRAASRTPACCGGGAANSPGTLTGLELGAAQGARKLGAWLQGAAGYGQDTAGAAPPGGP